MHLTKRMKKPEFNYSISNSRTDLDLNAGTADSIGQRKSLDVKEIGEDASFWGEKK
jgi:hypothetical protein